MNMNDIALAFGKIVLLAGGGIAAVGIISLLANLAAMGWVVFSEHFRAICKAESLIYEYRKNRADFLKWRETHGQ